MKGIEINGRITVFENRLPYRWRDIVGLNGLPEESLYELGLREVVYPKKTDYQYYSSAFLDKVNDIITFNVLDKTQEEIELEFSEKKNDLILKFEKDTDNLTKSIIGERGEEYRIAEEEAIAYKAAGYPEANIPGSISSDAIAKSYTNQEACDLILTMSINWRTAQAALRAKRLLLKEQTRTSTTFEELNTISSEWDIFIEALKAQIVT